MTVVEQLELPFPPPTRERLLARRRPWGLRQLALEIGRSARSIYRDRDAGLIRVIRVAQPGSLRPSYVVEPADALAYYDAVYAEYDPQA